MGTSTNGQICYGIMFEDEYEFPWDSDEYDGDIDDWWLRAVLGYKPSFELYNADGNWIDGIKPAKEKKDAYFQELRDFKAQNPKIPVELVNYCSGDFPMWILAVPSSCIEAYRGDPLAFQDLSVGWKDTEALFKFCNDYGLSGSNAHWWLSSYWG